MSIFSRKKKGDFSLEEIAKFGTYVLCGCKDGEIYSHLLIKSTDNQFALRVGLNTGLFEFLVAFVAHHQEMDGERVELVTQHLQAYFDLMQNLGTRVIDFEEMAELCDVILKYQDKEVEEQKSAENG